MGDKDILARVLAVVLAGMVTVWSSFSSRDRFTGEDAKVLETRISQLEHHISPEGQAVVHEAINNRIHRIEQDVNSLPPIWLKEDLTELKRRIERIEADHTRFHE